MAAESTETARACLSEKMQSRASDWMLPSKIMPTDSFALFTTGLPLLPPMMSASDTKLNWAKRLRLDALSIQRRGRENDGLFSGAAERCHSPAKFSIAG